MLEYKLDSSIIAITDDVFLHINKKCIAIPYVKGRKFELKTSDGGMGVRPIKRMYETLLSRVMISMMVGGTWVPPHPLLVTLRKASRRGATPLARYDIGWHKGKIIITAAVADKLLSW